MSELQISLLAIGVVVVLSVYGYSAWQQRQYRRRFGAAFKQSHGDALYQGALKSSLEETAGDLVAEATPAAVAPGRTSPVDDVCAALEPATDYIAVLKLPAAMNPGVLGVFWQQRFDFGKNVNVCGLTAAGGKWERVVAESQLSYTSFRLALQLADRNGAVSVGRLGDFRDLARTIANQVGADANLPDVEEAGRRAELLDAFCAEVDQMIGLNILPSGERLLAGGDLVRVAGQHGLSLQADGAFHLLDEQGHTIFSLSNYDNLPFQHHTLGQMKVRGLSLQLDVPRVQRPTERFDEMAQLAQDIARDLRAAVVDDHRVALSESALALIRNEVSSLEGKMVAWPLIPGSAQARRLFA